MTLINSENSGCILIIPMVVIFISSDSFIWLLFFFFCWIFEIFFSLFFRSVLSFIKQFLYVNTRWWNTFTFTLQHSIWIGLWLFFLVLFWFPGRIVNVALWCSSHQTLLALGIGIHFSFQIQIFVDDARFTASFDFMVFFFTCILSTFLYLYEPKRKFQYGTITKWIWIEFDFKWFKQIFKCQRCFFSLHSLLLLFELSSLLVVFSLNQYNQTGISLEWMMNLFFGISQFAPH